MFSSRPQFYHLALLPRSSEAEFVNVYGGQESIPGLLNLNCIPYPRIEQYKKTANLFTTLHTWNSYVTKPTEKLSVYM
jgi:hypothetical protein